MKALPTFFSASPIPVPPQHGQTSSSAWGRRPGQTRQYQHPFLSRKILEAGAVEYHRTFCPASDCVLPLGTFPESPSGSPGHISCKVAGSTVEAPRWRVLPTCLLLLTQGQEYNPGQESAQPTVAWAQPELQDPPQDTYEGPGNEMLKAGSFLPWH